MKWRNPDLWVPICAKHIQSSHLPMASNYADRLNCSSSRSWSHGISSLRPILRSDHPSSGWHSSMAIYIMAIYKPTVHIMYVCIYIYIYNLFVHPNKYISNHPYDCYWRFHGKIMYRWIYPILSPLGSNQLVYTCWHRWPYPHGWFNPTKESMIFPGNLHKPRCCDLFLVVRDIGARPVLLRRFFCETGLLALGDPWHDFTEPLKNSTELICYINPWTKKTKVIV